MKRVLLLLLFLPTYVFACDCDPPSVALELVRSKYVFWGTVVEKEYAQDSLTYTVTFDVERHFKNNKEKPRTLKFTKKSDGDVKGVYSSCGYTVNKGEKWLVYAYTYKDELVFSRPCSNSNRFKALGNIKQKELDILKKGNEIDLSKIIFHSRLIGSLYQAYEQAVPSVSLDTLITQLKPLNYNSLRDWHFENVIVNVDAKGKILNMFIPNHTKFKTTDVYDIHQIEHLPIEKELTDLQKDILYNLKKAKKWTPAKFTGVSVRSQIFVQVYFRKGEKPTISYN